MLMPLLRLLSSGSLAFFVALLVGCTPAPIVPLQASAPEPAPRAQLVQNYGRLPFRFEANQGQTDPEVGFLARGPGYGLFLKPAEAVLTLQKAEARPEAAFYPHQTRGRMKGELIEPPKVSATALRMMLVGADPDARMEGMDTLPGQVNYLRGSDPAQWKTGISTYAKVKVRQIYPGIDLVYYGNPRQLEYDFVVAPGADPQQIRWSFEGLDRPLDSKPEIDGEGNLLLKTGAGDLRVKKPVVYQEIGGQRRMVEGRFVLGENGGAVQAGFQLAGYNPVYFNIKG